MKKFYSVVKGNKTGIFESWEECKKYVLGYKGSIYKSFKNEKDAENFINSNNENINQEKEIKKKRKFEETETTTEQEKPAKKIKTEKLINVYTDGGCSKNGSKKAIAGIGVYFEGKEYSNISKRIEGKQTNNRAELTAILEALNTVKDDENILIHTDSEYSIKGITKINKINKNEDLFDQIMKKIKNRKGKTKFNKVKGHTGLKDGNFMADKLATDSLIN
jgi:ribonuclease HI